MCICSYGFRMMCGGWKMQGVKARCCSEGFPRVGWYITLQNERRALCMMTGPSYLP